MGLGIVHPEVVALRIAVGQVRAADALHPLQHVATGQHACAQVRPVLPATPTNHVVNSGKAQAAGVDVAVVHCAVIICVGCGVSQTTTRKSTQNHAAQAPPVRRYNRVIRRNLAVGYLGFGDFHDVEDGDVGFAGFVFCPGFVAHQNVE